MSALGCKDCGVPEGDVHASRCPGYYGKVLAPHCDDGKPIPYKLTPAGERFEVKS